MVTDFDLAENLWITRRFELNCTTVRFSHFLPDCHFLKTAIIHLVRMNRCPFCGQPAKLTREHVWSAWIGRLLGKSKYAFRQRDAHGNVVKEWKRPGLDLKPEVVCAQCNNGWMSKLENRAKAVMADMILKGKKVFLDSAKLETIAQF